MSALDSDTRKKFVEGKITKEELENLLGGGLLAEEFGEDEMSQFD